MLRECAANLCLDESVWFTGPMPSPTPNLRQPIVMDATLRDGGYQNNNGFTVEQVVAVVEAVAAGGVGWIEIGHGFGLGADRTMGPMGATDIEYLEAVQHVPAKIGMFANVNLCSEDDLERASEVGMDFARIGFIGFDGPHPFDGALALLETAKRRDLWAAINMVRTPMYRDHEILEIAKRSADNGADALYIVDSAGGMLPDEVHRLTELLVAGGSPPVGFHGHQNLDLGVANSLAAVQGGATYVDGTLMGIGRDSGNTQLEVLVAVLEKAGYRTGADMLALCAASSDVLSRILEVNGITEDKLLLGCHDLLSHAVPLARSAADQHGVAWQAVMAGMAHDEPFFETAEVADHAARLVARR